MAKHIIKAAILVAATALAGCATAGGDKAAYDKLLSDTVAAADKAKSVDGEWRDIRWKKSKIAMIPAAEKAAKAGDYAKAMKLLNTAKFQAEMGYKQAMEQKGAGPRF